MAVTKHNTKRLMTSIIQFSRFFSSVPFDPPPPIAPRRVVVTGLGMVTPLGCGVEVTWKRLIEGECGIRAITIEDLKMNGFDRETQLHTFDQLTSKVAGIVPCGSNPGEFNEELWLNSKEHRSIARFIGYALCAAAEALRDANYMPTKQDEKERTGPNHAAVTACATGAHSVGDATRMIQFGDADVMVAGGTEASIDALSIAGFCRSRALTTKYNAAPEEASRPFDCARDGFVFWRPGFGGDAYHITQPHGDGRGAILAMTRALEQSGLNPNQVDYINAHATSTPLGDAIEAKAIQSLFCSHATSGALALSSTKGAIGHLLGAAGAVEALFSILAIHHGIAPLTLNLSKPDPIFNGDFMPLSASKKMTVKAAMSNSFGFGGTNASLLFAALD
ncbi:hypothetical protein DH2020_030053 [Rehmannia glutinosa]|uniref:beta-ketoacyl-[acyl-carrier-protein] synthase I n=1 Tax=Rehmannia glutinosa TaxID=99300 RepID=A0ABR0VLX4_REHGL